MPNSPEQVTPSPTPNDIRSLLMAFLDMKIIVDNVFHNDDTPSLIPRYQEAIEVRNSFRSGIDLYPG